MGSMHALKTSLYAVASKVGKDIVLFRHAACLPPPPSKHSAHFPWISDPDHAPKHYPPIQAPSDAVQVLLRLSQRCQTIFNAQELALNLYSKFLRLHFQPFGSTPTTLSQAERQRSEPTTDLTNFGKRQGVWL